MELIKKLPTRKTITMKVANEIRELYSIGNYTQRGLAKKLNMNYWIIFNIINNKTWRINE